MSCLTKLLTDNLADNLQTKEKGLRGCNLLLINRSDLKSAPEDGTNAMVLTDLVLESSKVAFELPNIQQMNQALSEFTPQENDIDGYKHSINGVMRDLSADNLERICEMQLSEDGFVVVLQKMEQGTDKKETFEVYGLEAGLHLTANVIDSREYTTFTLASKDNYMESKPPRKLLIEDYATTKTAYDNLFIGS